MKAVATALVLIVGAAVVLWYGNTLNSWVLGGLIGGLAALLISIPISLTIFSYLSRRHEDAYKEELREELQERISLAQVDEFLVNAPETFEDEVEGSLYPLDEDEWNEEEEPFHTAYPASRMQHTSFPENRTLKKLPAPKRNTRTLASRQLSSTANTPGKTMQGRRTTRRLPSAGSAFSQHRSDALSMARREAAQQFEDDEVETNAVRPHSRVLPVRPQPAQPHPPVTKRASRQLTSQTDNAYFKQPHARSTEANIARRDSRNAAPLQGSRPREMHTERQLPQTDFLSDNYAQTTPIEGSKQTERLKPKTSSHERPGEMKASTDNIQMPLVRKAPYMYEDDPLRQELSYYFDNPIARRSSRYEAQQEDDSEE